jgi:DNA modification methylase
VEMCIRLGCPEGGTVLDPFAGSGTVGEVASKLGRNAVLVEINPSYIDLIKERLILYEIQIIQKIPKSPSSISPDLNNT